MPRIIGFAGFCGVGKTAAINLCEELGFGSRLYVGQFVLDELATRKLAQTPENEKLVRIDLRTAHGPEYFARLAAPIIERTLGEGVNVLIDAVASLAELKFYQSRFTEVFELIAIESLFDTRVKRLSMRSARSLSSVEIRKRDDLERTTLLTDQVLIAATMRVANDSSLGQFHLQLLQQLGFSQ